MKKTMKKGGQKPLFDGGRITPLQDMVALLLSQGMSQTEAAREKGLAVKTVNKWLNYPIYQELVKKYQEERMEKAKEIDLNELSILTEIVRRGMERAKPSTSDVIRAVENLMKAKGLYAPQKKEIEIKENLKKLSDKQLAVLKEAKNAASTTTFNRGGDTEEE